MRAVREQRTAASTSSLPLVESAESSANHSKSADDLVMLPSVSQLERPATVSPKKKRSISFSHDVVTIGFSDFLAVLGPSLLDQSRERMIKSVFAKHAGGKEGATFEAFAAMLEELSPVATVRQNLWAAACKVKTSGHKTGSATAPRSAATSSGDKASLVEDQSKLIATLRAKIRELEAQAVNAKSALKLESELHALRRQNAALRKESATAVAKAYEIKEQTEADVKARGAPHVRLLNKLISDKDQRLEAKSAEIAELKEKLEASEQLRLQETKKLQLQLFKIKQKLGESEEGAAELLQANLRQLQEMRSGLLVGMADEPVKAVKTPTSMDLNGATPKDIEAAEPIHVQATAALAQEGTKEPPKPVKPAKPSPAQAAQPKPAPGAEPEVAAARPKAKAKVDAASAKASGEPAVSVDVKQFVSEIVSNAIGSATLAATSK